MPAALPLRHFLLALAVVAVWGINFVVIKFALGALPPLLMATLRFGLVLLPGLFFCARPAVPLGNLALYGFLIGFGQFGLLYVAMNGHISPGLASLVIQLQVFFTIALAMRMSGERVRRYQWLALLLAAGGIVVIVLHTDGSTTPLGLLLVLLAALAWAGGNIAAKQGAPANMLAYVVWSSAFAVPPLVALSLAVEGWDAIAAALATADGAAWAAVVWQAWGNSLFGYAAWGWLLARHPAATITPMAMLVPVFGMGASALWLDEALPPWKLAAAALVLAGLAINLLWPRLRAALAARG
ncbi:EamA family transporter [Sulfuritalea sp.]|uniref:EamA family transporter n=1 Tax=Sulfuritalea sp. TaxID=2480090 RepID=UPI001AD05AA2|nr:EamA family transporter [Sulfuritalea sp.]MBN8476602.1 EamA family transporter [Sulfuritalea sp.]